MDSQTHIEFAIKLAHSINGNPKAAIASLFPQIDRHPPTLHRLYAHNVFKALPITRLGLRFLNGLDFSSVEKAGFEYQRFQSESPRFQTYLEAIPASDGDELSLKDESTALVCFVSHLYLDTFNQPTQPFAPLNVYCSGQWELWKRLGDFRLRLYTTGLIDRLRRDLFQDPLWSEWEKVDLQALVQAMMARMCEFSERKIPGDLTGVGMGALQWRQADRTEFLRSLGLLKEFEGVLHGLHQKYLEGTADLPKESQEPLLAGPKR